MSFTQQQLEDAYLQMEKERQEDTRFAQIAADKLAALVDRPGEFRPTDSSWLGEHGAISPQTSDHVLVIRVSAEDNWSEADNWRRCFDDLETAGVKMDPWHHYFRYSPTGEFDVSQDPAFSGRSKLTYKVRVEYYP